MLTARGRAGRQRPGDVQGQFVERRARMLRIHRNAVMAGRRGRLAEHDGARRVVQMQCGEKRHLEAPRFGIRTESGRSQSLRQQAPQKALRLQGGQVPRKPVAQHVFEVDGVDVHDATVAEQAEGAESPRRAHLVNPPQRLLGRLAQDGPGDRVACLAAPPEGEHMGREIGEQARDRRLALLQCRLQLGRRGHAASGKLGKYSLVVSIEWVHEYLWNAVAARQHDPVI